MVKVEKENNRRSLIYSIRFIWMFRLSLRLRKEKKNQIRLFCLSWFVWIIWISASSRKKRKYLLNLTFLFNLIDSNHRNLVEIEKKTLKWFNQVILVDLIRLNHLNAFTIEKQRKWLHLVDLVDLTYSSHLNLVKIQKKKKRTIESR